MILFRLNVATWRAPCLRAGAMCLLLLLAGCEEDILMPEPSEKPFTLYGVLSPQLKEQSIRVYTVDERLQPIPPEPLAATFTSTDLQSGEVRVWQDSLIHEEPAGWVNVFWSPFEAEYGHTYHIEVTGQDGEKSEVTVSVPPMTEMVLPDEASFTPELIPVRVQGGAPRLIHVKLEYLLEIQIANTLVFYNRLISYDGQQHRESSEWVIPVNLSRDYQTIFESLLKDPLFVASSGMTLHRLTLSLVVATEDWDPPGGAFDPEVLGEPGIMTNIEKGFGFVGAGYRDTLEWVPPEDLYTAAGFLVP